MKKHHSTAIIAAMAVFSIALAGCRELPGKEAADNELEQTLSSSFKQEAAESVKQSLSDASAALGDVIQNTTGMIEEKVNSSGISREFSTSLPIGSASVLKLDNAVGEVTVAPASGDDITVQATVIVHDIPRAGLSGNTWSFPSGRHFAAPPRFRSASALIRPSIPPRPICSLNSSR